MPKTRGHPAGKTRSPFLPADWQQRASKTMLAGILSDAYDAYTAPQRAYRGLLDPMSDEAVKNMADLAGMVTLGSGAVPAPKGALRSGMARNADDMADEGIRAYHGSPHDFDKFSMDKIGTGEGAQAYGHGLYFADNEGVARQYRDDLSGMRNGNAKRALAKAGGDVDAAIDAAREQIARLESLPDKGGDPRRWAAQIQLQKDKIDVLNAEKAGLNTKGSMYEVRIKANPDDFLDWDKPFRDQPEIAKKLGVDPYARSKQADDIIRRIKEDMALAGRTEMDDIDRANYDLAERLNSEFAVETAGSSAPRSADMAAELNAKGVPGIKYLDYGSRNAGEGSRNYVVFDDSLIEIVKKYGIAGALAAGLLTEQQAKAFQDGRAISQTDYGNSA
jgi:hypothetical protein